MLPFLPPVRVLWLSPNSQSLGIPVKSLRSGSGCTKRELGPSVGKWRVRTVSGQVPPFHMIGSS